MPNKMKLLVGLIVWDILEFIVWIIAIFALSFFGGFGQGIGSPGVGLFVGFIMFLVILFVGTYLVLMLIEKMMEWALDVEEVEA